MEVAEFKELRELNALSVEDTAHLLGVTPKTVYRWENGESEPKKAFVQLLKDRLEYKRDFRDPHPDFTFIDLFAGIGGIRKGFEASGGKCVFTSEWDEYAQRTYRANFHDDHKIVGDITKVDPADIPRHDVLLAGFPCQPFSIAGVSKKKSLGREHGFMDKAQGTLFFDVLRILKHHRPAAFLLENVKNLKSHNKGDTFATIVGALENELGYKISCRVIDGKGYVPQHRERIFIAGFREDCDFDFDKLDFKTPDNGPVIGSILHEESEEAEAEYTLPENAPGSNASCRINDKYTLTDKLWKYLQDYAAKHKAAGNGFGYGLVGPNDKARTLSARYYKDGSEILIKQEGKNPRRLTPRECARLMGFDPDRNTRMIIPVSDTRAYKQFGNSVVVPVITEIAKYMRPYILDQKEKELIPEVVAAE
ncbi:DNA (cytosine-5-)-methyltransferase [Emcibacter sp.]|uniref:DNA (cytosine-5-)-methyltransferase n=1 Tax=Emcibacter sp. TaxID=1979954 RepID=UPI003A9365F4